MSQLARSCRALSSASATQPESEEAAERASGRLKTGPIRIIPLVAYLCAAGFGILVWYEVIRLIFG
jgi:hypothetical protein